MYGSWVNNKRTLKIHIYRVKWNTRTCMKGNQVFFSIINTYLVQEYVGTSQSIITNKQFIIIPWIHADVNTKFKGGGGGLIVVYTQVAQL